MSMYGYDVSSFYDYGFSNPAITGGSIYGNSISPMAAAVDYDDELYVRRRPPPRQRPPPNETPNSSPPKHRHDGTSPLPLGMDWSFAPLIWEGRNSVWPHDLHKGWSYCVTIPSLSSLPSAAGSVFYGVKVGIQSPEGVTTTRTVPRRFNEFLKLYSELKKEFPKKNLPPAPPKGLIRTRSKKVLVERICALECWMTKLLSDIDVSRTAPVAIFLELEAAARESFSELNQNDPADLDNSCAYETSDVSASSPEKENHDELNIENVSDRGIIHSNKESSRDIEDLITRLNQETVARQYFSTKVKDLEMELETKSQSSKDMQCDMEKLQRKCIELELRLTIEQDARAYAESMKKTMIQKNELLMKELDDAKEQVEILRKQKEEMELKSKSDVLEVKPLGKSHLELKQELGKFSEDKVIVDTCVSLSDTIDVLETSDTQIGLLLAKAQVLGEDAETGSGSANEDDELKKLLGDILIENAKLRKQVNSVIHHALSKSGKDNAQE